MSDPPLLARLRIVLCATSHPGNIGAAARALKTMGVARLVLVQPRRFPDAEATARASRATDVLGAATVVATLDAALAGCVASYGFTARPRELTARVLPVRDAAREAMARAAHGDVAFVFGNETFGLANAELERCSALAYIPASDEYGSLNLAAAVQVACHEARAAAGEERLRAPRFPPASHEDLQQLWAHAERTLVELAFLDPVRPRRLMPRLRRLFGRAELEHEEVNILRGILARIDAAVARGRVAGTAIDAVPGDRARNDLACGDTRRGEPTGSDAKRSGPARGAPATYTRGEPRRER